MARNTVYTVCEGMEGGYLPESVSYFSSKRAAQSYMVERANDARDNDYKVTGSARSGWYSLNDGRSLDQYIELNETDFSSLGITSYDDLETLNNA